ncbi:MAG TPA: AmmeMemoRadiSam system protein A [Anaerolineales bacterium]|nr:AmmeMemoRadiSam system protein A [Anaerolineales bacterium]HUS83833.1 AmmeMemoRadiSam system protein A [Anaerolineales bacterium]
MPEEMHVRVPLSEQEKQILLDLAHQSIVAAVYQDRPPRVDLDSLPDRLQNPGASFVTLTRSGLLRGCIGTLKHLFPLAQDVILRAGSAAIDDPRFPPLQADEIEDTEIEISVLTTPQPLEYNAPEEIPNLLVSGLDGVTIVHDLKRATFLPQVWQKVEGSEHFLSLLCQKALLPTDAWKRGDLEISTYRVESFHRSPPNKTT